MWPLSNYYFFFVIVFLNLLPGSQRLNHKAQILRQVLHRKQVSTQLFNHNFNISVFTAPTSMFSTWSLFPTLRDQMNNCQKCSLVKSSLFKAVSTCFAEEQKERQGQSKLSWILYWEPVICIEVLFFRKLCSIAFLGWVIWVLHLFVNNLPCLWIILEAVKSISIQVGTAGYSDCSKYLTHWNDYSNITDTFHIDLKISFIITSLSFTFCKKNWPSFFASVLSGRMVPYIIFANVVIFLE